jgi:hypothetical protein
MSDRTIPLSVYFHWSPLFVSWQRIYKLGTVNVSINHTFPILMYYCTHKVLQSHVRSSQADFLYSSVLIQLTAILRPVIFPSESSGIVITYLRDGHRPTVNTYHVTPTHYCCDATIHAQLTDTQGTHVT